MSKKKHRQDLPAAPAGGIAPSSTSAIAESAITGITSTPSIPFAAPADARAEPSFLTTPAGRFLHMLFRIFSSLQLAVFLLSLFALCLITATILESRHSAEIAQELVYRTWWFTVLLFMLGTNIVFAALKKMDSEKLAAGHWPWKKYQTGFLVTHVGLITLVFGGLVTAMAGAEGQIHAIDVEDKAIQNRARLPRTTSTLYLTNNHKLIVTRIPLKRGQRETVNEEIERIAGGQDIPKELERRGARQWIHDISPGSLPWYDTDTFQSNIPPAMSVLRFLAAPVRGESYSIGDGRLRVTNYFPHTEDWGYTAAGNAGHSRLPPFPAVQLRVESKLFTPAVELWVSGFPSEVPSDLKGLASTFQMAFGLFHRDTDHLRSVQSDEIVRPNIAFELLTAGATEQVKEFVTPPARGEMGSRGQLVLFVGSQKKVVRIPLGMDSKGSTHKLDETGLSVKILAQGDLFEELTFDKKLGNVMQKLRRELGEYPFVRLEATRGNDNDSAEMMVCSRIPNLPGLRDSGKKFPEITGFYHVPDGLFGRDKVVGAVQILRDTDGKTFFRAFGPGGNLSAPGEPINLTESGVTEVLPWREAARTTIRPIGYIPQATIGTTVKPRNTDRIGAKPRNYLPALVGTVWANNAEHPYQVRLGDRAAEVRVGREDADHDVYLVRYTQAVQKLDFDVTLKRARDEKDPGTERSGKYESDILLKWKDTKAGVDKELTYTLFMNHTLDFSGYRFFQANFEQTDHDWYDPAMEMERKANVSGITLARDPGLHFKTTGTIIVVLGIFIMFYMRAYFFKRSARVQTP